MSLYEASNNGLSHITRGCKEMLYWYVMGDIQVNSYCMTVAFIHFVAFPVLDKLAPVGI